MKGIDGDMTLLWILVSENAYGSFNHRLFDGHDQYQHGKSKGASDTNTFSQEVIGMYLEFGRILTLKIPFVTLNKDNYVKSADWFIKFRSQ